MPCIPICSQREQMSTGLRPIHRRSGLRPLSLLSAIGLLLLAAILIALIVDGIFFRSSTPVGTGSGVSAAQARTLPPFTGVEIAGANNVTVQVGARQAVVVHADTNLLGRVTTRVHSGILVIGTTPGSLSAKTPMFVAVSVPSLDRLTLQGDGNISVTGINSRSFTIELPGDGTINAAGTTAELDVTISGTGTAQLGQLVGRNVKAALSGDGSLMLTATNRLNATLSGSGTITYNGNPPHATKTVTGTGTITGT